MTVKAQKQLGSPEQTSIFKTVVPFQVSGPFVGLQATMTEWNDCAWDPESEAEDTLSQTL